MEKLRQHDLELSKETTPVPTPTTPGASSSNTSSGHSHRNTGGITIDSIPEIPPFRPRKSKEWTPPPVEADSMHHLTIGPGGVEWARRLKEDSEIHRSTDCIAPKDASSSDSDLLKSSPLWPPRPRSPPQIPARARPLVPQDPSLSDSAKSVSSQETPEEAAAKAAAEELAAKKTRVKQSLMKRARSVAIFSLKLKERRAREAQEKGLKPPVTPTAPLPPPQQGGELACIPIEKLIQLDDLKRLPKPSNSQPGAL
ncbi:unnamed protein product [Diabrotica balteata]|nr:unnamed protein product [Diabrotica balteata]